MNQKIQYMSERIRNIEKNLELILETKEYGSNHNKIEIKTEPFRKKERKSNLFDQVDTKKVMINVQPMKDFLEYSLARDPDLNEK